LQENLARFKEDVHFEEKRMAVSCTATGLLVTIERTGVPKRRSPAPVREDDLIPRSALVGTLVTSE
jgi:hypothetical protein